MSRGDFLFNYGISHISLDGKGAAAILHKKKIVSGNIASIYPLYQNTSIHKRITGTKRIPASITSLADHQHNNTIISLEALRLYPEKFKKAQWILVVK